MIATAEECYQAMDLRDSEYEGLFYVAVTSTGIFCRPTCPARKPRFENCVFYETPRQALDAGFRPCKRCRPMEHPDETPELVKALAEAIDAQPDRKWQEADLREFFADASTVRRQFKKRFGMTFLAYARARRLAAANDAIQAGRSVTDAQLASGYESGSGFRDAFARLIGSAPSQHSGDILHAAWIDTRLGPMVAVANETSLLLLEFADRREIPREIDMLRRKTRSAILPGETAPILQIRSELDSYFGGTTLTFRTPITLIGTPFQAQVWEALRAIPPGETRNYTDLAVQIGRPGSSRAVGAANGSNHLALIVPCHRVIGSDGTLTGYAGGLSRKAWLIDHEIRRAHE